MRKPAPRTEREIRLGLRLAKMEARAEILRDGCAALLEQVETYRQELGRAGLLASQVALSAAPADHWHEAAGVAREILTILREDRLAYGLLERVTEELAEARGLLSARGQFLALPDPELAVSGRAGDAALVWEEIGSQRARVDDSRVQVKPVRGMERSEPSQRANAVEGSAGVEAPAT